MDAKNSDGLTVLQIVKNGASRVHFEALQNSSRLFSRLGPKGDRLGTGTTRNEQLHRELKSWMRNIILSHKGRFENGIRIFLLFKLLTHSSAAYYPTLSQSTQSRLLFIIAGKIRHAGFFSPPNNPLIPQDSSTSTRKDLHKSSVFIDDTITAMRIDKHTQESIMWKKRKVKPHLHFPNKTNIFKRPRKHKNAK